MYVRNVHGCARRAVARTRTWRGSAGRRRSSSGRERRRDWRRTTVAPRGSYRKLAAGPSTLGASALVCLACYSPAPAPRVPRQPADALAQLGKLDPGGPRGLREQARPGHAGKRVRLPAKDVPLCTQPEVDPRISPQLERPVRRECQLLQLPGRLGVELRREDLLGHPGRVLAFVVEQFVLRDDLAHRQRDVAQDTDRDLPPSDELLDHHFAVVATRQIHRRVQALGVLDEGHPDGGPHPGRLHDHRPPEGGGHVLGRDRRGGPETGGAPGPRPPGPPLWTGPFPPPRAPPRPPP